MMDSVKDKKPLATTEQIKMLFSTLPQVHNLHTSFYKDLSANKENAGSVFLNHIDQMKLYAEYFNKYHKANEVYQELSRMKNFVAFDEEATRKAGNNLNLMALLVQPVQRLPRYELLLEVLALNLHLKFTPTETLVLYGTISSGLS